MRNRWRRIMRRLRFSTVALTTELFGIDISELSDVRTRVLRKPTSSTVPSLPATLTTWPTRNGFSIMINIEPRRLARLSRAASATAKPPTPSPARTEYVGKPSSYDPWIKNPTAIPRPTKRMPSLISWLSRLPRRRRSDATMASARWLAAIRDNQAALRYSAPVCIKVTTKRSPTDPEDRAEQRHREGRHENDRQRGQEGVPAGPRLLCPMACEMPVQAIYPVDKSQADGKPDHEPEPCHDAIPAIGALAQAGKRSI